MLLSNWTTFSSQETQSFTLPGQPLRVEIPESQSAIRRTWNQVGRIGRQRTDPNRAAVGMFQDGLDAPRDHGPHQRGRICGAGDEELAAWAEATAVDAVAMSLQRRERQLGEVFSIVYPEGFVPGAGSQQFGGEGTPVDVVLMVS